MEGKDGVSGKSGRPGQKGLRSTVERKHDQLMYMTFKEDRGWVKSTYMHKMELKVNGDILLTFDGHNNDSKYQEISDFSGQAYEAFKKLSGVTGSFKHGRTGKLEL